MGKKSLGRQKVEMVKMKNNSNLQVTFSKRRSGLFKKASELCTLCGVEIGIIVFSPGNKVFSFGHPEIGNVIGRYINGNPQAQDNSGTLHIMEAHRNAHARELNMQLTELTSQIEVEKRRGEELNHMRRARQGQYWWEAPVEELSLPQLQQLKSALEELKKNVAKQVEKLLIQTTNSQQLFMGSSSAAAGVFPDNIEMDVNMMPQGYNPPPPNMIPPGFTFNLNPEGYNPCPPGFGHSFF
ncbi:Agamous-like MADS-box protein AGL61 [Hibiscus syriacus]|uniref:Agamous-like MADS-box protein AGL61 n=1 Tax=Hibiscus syriacus TaxID=106335 RepID=A0A6A2Y1W1_HIBSY|nr:agamous-like MADS-box protein AGL62 [Hibiscus syriacus]KAE8677380.1 Agamous-like MADS-box protein AGL61 [Hibiscus syriacus]